MDPKATPGLSGPRSLEGSVEMNVPAAMLEQADQPAQPAEMQAVDSTTATTPAIEQGVQEPVQQEADEQPRYSERELNRVQKLANEKAEAEAKAAIYQQQLQAMVNAQQQQPQESFEDRLSKQFSTFDKSLGYPTDPREFASFSAQISAEAARRESARLVQQDRSTRETNELMAAHPDIADDPLLRGATIAIKQNNPGLTLAQAAAQAKKELSERIQKRAVAAQARDNQVQAEAYVETTRGASPTRAAAPAPEKMSLNQMEKYLKENNAWNE